MFVGTLYPLALEALTGEKISVGAPFFNLTFGPLFVPLLLAVPFGPLLAWKRGDLCGVAQRLIGGVCARAWSALAATFALPRAASRCSRRSASALAVFVMAGALTDLAERVGLFRLPLGDRASRARAACRARPGARRSRISASAYAARHCRARASGAPSGSSR